MRKILFIDELFYPMVGGIQMRTKSFTSRWLAGGHEITLTAIDHLGNLPPSENIDGINVLRLFRNQNYYKSGFFGRDIVSIFIYTFRLFNFLKNNLKNYDFIVFNQFPILPLITYRFFFILRKDRPKAILDFVEYRAGSFWFIIQWFMFKSADKVVCISDYIFDEVSRFKKQENLCVIPNSVDLKSYYVSNEKSYYVFIGRIEPHKHLEHAIQAVLLLNNEKEFHIIGVGSEFVGLKEKYKEYQRIVFHGFLDDIDKNKILSMATVLILPSEQEGLPTVAIEALMCNVPIVTTEYPNNGTKHFVRRENIGLVSAPNAISISENIRLVEENINEYQNRCMTLKKKYCIDMNSELFLNFAIND